MRAKIVARNFAIHIHCIAKKLEKYLKAGGSLAHIQGNVRADELAKKGANRHDVNQTRRFLAYMRRDMSRILHEMLIDIWMEEKQYMYNGDSTYMTYDNCRYSILQYTSTTVCECGGK